MSILAIAPETFEITLKNTFMTDTLTKVFSFEKTDTDFFEGQFADGVAVDLGVFFVVM